MRRLITATLTLGLASALLVAPTVTLPTAAPTPVSPKIEMLRPVGVNQRSLAQLQTGCAGSQREDDTSAPGRHEPGSPGRR